MIPPVRILHRFSIGLALLLAFGAAVADGVLVLTAEVGLPTGAQPHPLELEVAGERHRLDRTGRLELVLPPGLYHLRPLTNAVFAGPTTVAVADGERSEAHFVLIPNVVVDIEAQPDTTFTGDTVELIARATTDFESVLPLQLSMTLPDNLRALGTTRLTAPLSASGPRELRVDAVATGPGEGTVSVKAAGWAAEASETVLVKRPATLEISVEPSVPAAEVDETLRLKVVVRNVGARAASGASVSLPEVPGLAMPAVLEQLDLPPNEEAIFEVDARVLEDAPETLEIQASVELVGEETTSTASVEVLRPQPRLERRLSSEVALPGESVTVELVVHNLGGAEMPYTLSDTVPEWIAPAGATEFSGVLPPGSSVVHEYEGSVRFGLDATGQFQAVLSSPAGNLEQRALLQRATLPVELQLSADTLRLGGSARLRLILTNPATRRARLRLQASPEAALNTEPLPDEVVLEPKERLEIVLGLEPAQPGSLRYEVAVFNGPIPVAFPAHVDLEVLDRFSPQRTSSVRLPFEIQFGDGDELLVRHELPAGSTYVSGSSTLSGTPLPEPLVRSVGTRRFLYWRVPYSSEGELVYRIEHQQPLPRLREPSMTLLIGRLEVPLAGDVDFGELAEASALVAGQEGMIVEPRAGTTVRGSDQITVIVEAPYPGSAQVLVNGEQVPRRKLGKAEFDEGRGVQRLEYFGIGLQTGRNVLEVEAGGEREQMTIWLAGTPAELRLRPLSLLADGSTPLAIEIEAVDANGIAAGFGGVTIETDGEPLLRDSHPNEPGHQVLMQEGKARLELQPEASVRRVFVGAEFNGLETTANLHLVGSSAMLLQGLASGTARIEDGRISLSGTGRGYLEAPLLDGSVQLAFDSESALLKPPKPPERFPLTGAAEEARPGLESGDGVAVRYDDEQYSLGYYHGRIEVPGVEDSFEATALHGEIVSTDSRAELQATAFAALLPDERIREEIRPDGTRVYRLSHPVRPGSEEVSVVVGVGAAQTLTPLRRTIDYVLDDQDGVLILASPLQPNQPDFEPVSLVVVYSPRKAPRTSFAGGAGLSYRGGDGMTAEFGVVHRGELFYGAAFGYETAGNELELRYSNEGTDGSDLTLTGSVAHGWFEAGARARYRLEQEALTADASATLTFAEGARTELRHRVDATIHESTALVEVNLQPILIGLGGGYDWLNGGPIALGRLGWTRERVTLQLEHRQPLSAATSSASNLRATMEVADGLDLEAGVEYRPDSGVNGTVALIQEFGEGNYSVSYQLPGSSGEGNRARFGIETPLPLGGGWSLDLSGGYEQGLTDGGNEASAGVGLKYEAEELVLTLGSEVSLGSGDEMRVVLRGGASGSIDEAQAISVDTLLEFESELTGDATLSYSYRHGVHSLLSYHRLSVDADSSFEGEIAYTVNSPRQWQLRPSFAYRAPLAELERVLMQVSLGGNVYPLPRVSVGAAVHHQMQPWMPSSRTAVSAEAGYELHPGLWLNAGYTFGGFEGLTDDSRGFHVRLDVMGAYQE